MVLGNVVFDSGIYGAGVATAVVMNLAVGFSPATYEKINKK